MAVMTLQAFANLVTGWAKQNQGRFRYYWPVKGGWESWIQVDLAAFMLAQDGTFDVLREQPIYANPRLRADLLVNDATAPADQKLAVEMKAESWENRSNFVAGVREDLDKLQSPRAPAYAAATGVMMAVAFSPESYQAVHALTSGTTRIFRDVFVDPGGEVAAMLAARTAAGGWMTA